MEGINIPQAVDLEMAVIGAILIDNKAIDDLLEVFTDPAVFYDTRHQIIFKIAKALYDENRPIDLLTVVEGLTKKGQLKAAGSSAYLIDLTQKVVSSAHIDYHAQIILQKYVTRQLIEFCNRGLKLSYNPEVDTTTLVESIGVAYDRITGILSNGYKSISWNDAVSSIPARVEFLSNNTGELTGLPTGLTATDRHFSGWQPEDFVVIGADSGMGKTAFVMNNMLAVAKNGDAVGMFSMEMSVTQLAIRGIAVESNYHMNQLSRNGFEKPQYFDNLMEVVSRVKEYPIYIDDQAALTVSEMKRKARTLKRNYDIKMLVIDFIQMFSGDKDTRINVSEAARACKNLAKELKIPVIALSQLSREVRKAKWCLPSKHHLKESSAIEEAADIIGLLYRPGYYGFTRDGNPEVYQDLGIDESSNALLIVAKNRNGALGNVQMHYVEDKTKYINPEDHYSGASYMPLNDDDQTAF
jgi:replicative DNA helicase